MRPIRTALLIPFITLLGACAVEDARSPGPESASDVAGEEILYSVSFPNVAHHEARISVRIDGLGPDPLEMRMSRSSPGRYALHEFTKNVYDVSAVDGAGAPLEAFRHDLHGWTIAGHDGTVVFDYTLYGDRADGTYAGIDRSQAHLNMPASFAWPRGHEDRSIRIAFAPPEGADWQVATQLARTDDPLVYTAPNLYYFLDSPTHLGDLSVREWELGPAGAGQTIRVAVHHDATEADVDRFVDAVRRIVDEEIAMYGEAPEFDYGEYTFISVYLPWASGDGMEHRNSTILTSTASLAGDQIGLLGTVAHEFFHAWNVERIRPASLEPFDFERANVSDELWLAEGFTSYFDDLALRRAGLIDDGEFARRLGNAINTVTNGPGRMRRSPIEMSRWAPFVDAAVSIDPQNLSNIFISYYTWGSVVGAGLELELRSRDPGLSADEFMRELWRRHGEDEVPYTVQDVEEALAAVTDEAFARDFMDRFVRGTEVPRFEELLPSAGMILRRVRPDAATFGRVQVTGSGGALVLTSQTLEGEPLYAAGLDVGDRILEIDGVPAGSTSLTGIAEAHRPGDTVPIRWQSRGVALEGQVTLMADPTLDVVTWEQAGLPITPEIINFRGSWLGSRTGLGR